jgi:hypothetical protein
MARGRFLSRSISASEQLASVSIEAALLFTWCLPHLDVEGRLAGEAIFIKSNVVPLRDEITLKRIPKLIGELAAAVDRDGVSLVVWYEAGRRQVLFFPGFEEQQEGLRKDREASSKLPAVSEAIRVLAGATPDQLRSDAGSNSGSGSGSTPAQGEVEVEVQGEEKVKGKNYTPNNTADAAASEPSKNWPARLTEHFQREVGHVALGHLAKVLKPFVDRDGVEIIETAITYYALERRALGRAGKFTWFAEDIAQWIDNAKQPLQLDDGTFTPLGERLYGLNGARR